MRISSFLTACVAALVLSACGDSGEQVKSAFNQELRNQFVQTATAQCVENAPQNTPLSEDELSTVCGCTAETIFDQVSAEDLARIMSGELNAELTAKISRATVECAGKALNRAASAASAGTAAEAQ